MVVKKSRGLGGVFKGVLIFLGIVFLILIGVGIYFYNFYIFDTVEICTGDYIPTKFSCETSNDCLDVLENPEEYLNLTELGVGEYVDLERINLKDFGILVGENFGEISSEIFSCEEYCMVRSVDGLNSQFIDGQISKDCLEENKIIMEIRGGDIFEIWRNVKR